MKTLLALLLLSATAGAAQVPSPTGGALGQAGTFPFRYGTTVTMTDADYPLTYPQTGAGFIKFTGTLTATRNITGFPTCNLSNINYEISIENTTTQTLMLNSTVPVLAGQQGGAKCDGTNYISTGGGGSSGVTSINTVTGAFTFTGSGVSCSYTTCTFTGASSLAWSAITGGTNLNSLLVGTTGSLAPIGGTGGVIEANNFGDTMGSLAFKYSGATQAAGKVICVDPTNMFAEFCVLYQGAWSSSTTYGYNAIVSSSGSNYLSINSSNLNQTPASSPSYWFPLGGTGGGTVTNFTAGNLAPLFTTSVANGTTTPALTFALSNAAQNSVLAGPATGGAGAPSYQTAPTISAANMTNFPTLNQNTTGTAANVTGVVAYANGGTNANTAAQGFANLYQTTATTLGDLIYGGTSGAPTRLAGNTTTTPCYITETGTGSGAQAPTCGPIVPPNDVHFYPAAVSNAGAGYNSAWTIYDNNAPQVGSVIPASSGRAYLAFNAGATLPQYAELTISVPGYWTSIDVIPEAMSTTATTGNVTWELQAGCTTSSVLVGSPTYSSAVADTSTINSTLGYLTVFPTMTSFAVPGTTAGCPSSPTTPTDLTLRIYRSASDTMSGNANFLGTTIIIHRNQ